MPLSQSVFAAGWLVGAFPLLAASIGFVSLGQDDISQYNSLSKNNCDWLFVDVNVNLIDWPATSVDVFIPFGKEGVGRVSASNVSIEVFVVAIHTHNLSEEKINETKKSDFFTTAILREARHQKVTIRMGDITSDPATRTQIP